MKTSKILLVAMLCLGLCSCVTQLPLADQTPAPNASHVIPLPEADNQFSSGQMVDTIVVDKDGTMQETQYPYDADQGGIVINNYEEVSGSDASVFFPGLDVGLMWWGGYWVDHDGYYWNGYDYAYVKDPQWHDHWDHYWNHHWQDKHQQYMQSHPGAGGHGNFNHHNGMNRPNHQGGGGGGHRGGGGGHR